MITDSTPLHVELLAFLFIGIPLAALLWGASIVAIGIDEGTRSRSTTRRLLRMQRFLFRGRYLIGKRRPLGTSSSGFVIIYRGIIIVSLGLWAVRITGRIIESM